MERNMNDLDKKIRMFGGGGAAVLGLILLISGTVAIGLLLAVVGGVLFTTSMINFCPIYRAIGFSTYKGTTPPDAK